MIILKIDFSDYVNINILSYYNNNNILYLIVSYNKNLCLIKYNYGIYNKELLIIINKLKI